MKNPDIEFKHNKKKMPKNIYNGQRYNEHYKKFNIVHYVFKYKLVTPLLKLSRYILRNVMIKKVKKTSHNTNMWLFNKAYDEAVKKWCLYHLRNSGPIEKRRTKRQMMKYIKNKPYLTIIKNIILTIWYYDTAYREFFNVLMHEIALHMVKEYARSDKYPNKKTGHLFFTTDIYDVEYYVLEKTMRYQLNYQVIKSKELLKK